VVAPGADPSQIRLAFTGAAEATLARHGDLSLSVADGEVLQRTPVVYQEINGDLREVEGSFRLLSDSAEDVQVGFELGRYDPTLPLIIDPKIDYSTYLGGSSGDEAFGVTVDASGNVYLAGWTWSSDFPTFSATQSSNLSTDLFVSKIDPTGSGLIFSTYLGGSGEDLASDIAVDASGNVYLTGRTDSSDFPTLNAYQMSRRGLSDCILTKLSAAGSSLVFSTYLGGYSTDEGRGIDVDGGGATYVTGATYSSDFPTKNAFQGTWGSVAGLDLFVSKFDAAGTALSYSTYLGGSGTDDGFDIVVNSLNEAYVVGLTDSSDFPTQNATQGSLAGNRDAFISLMDVSGGMTFSTFYGGASEDWGIGVALDPLERAYMAGWTQSTDFPTLNAYQTTHGGGKDAFVAEFQSNGSPAYSTYFGGSGEEETADIAVDSLHRSHVTGWTNSTDYPLRNPIQALPGGATDGFVFVLDASGDPVHSTYLGGSLNNFPGGIAVDSRDNSYVTGYTYASDFPTRDALQPTNAGERDVFLTKIDNSALDFFIAAVPAGVSPAGSRAAVREPVVHR
jgi:hypothetical protein